MENALCLGCLKTVDQETSKNIFAEGCSIAENIFNLTNLSISSTDTNIPPYLCLECNHELNRALTFRNQLLEHHEHFKRLEFQIKIEDPESEVLISTIKTEPQEFMVKVEVPLDPVEEDYRHPVDDPGQNGSVLPPFILIDNNEAFTCEPCNKTFKAKSYVTQHLRSIHSDRIHRCTICGKKFSTKGDLKKHALKHAGNKPHKCPKCDRSYVYESDLKRHLLNHEQAKPFVCCVCGKGFARNDHLAKHQLSHERKRMRNCR